MLCHSRRVFSYRFIEVATLPQMFLLNFLKRNKKRQQYSSCGLHRSFRLLIEILSFGKKSWTPFKKLRSLMMIQRKREIIGTFVLEKNQKSMNLGNTVDMSHISYLKIEIQCNENHWVFIGERTSRAKWLAN